MQAQQQLVGVNQRLGNMAVPNMQGTTRSIYDILQVPAANSEFVFFQNVQTRPYPFSNLSQNRFEVGESLAIQSIALVSIGEDFLIGANIDGLFAATNSTLFNLYIGNQRVIKDLDLFSIANIGTTNNFGSSAKTIFRFETPIVIPPQIEFYATVKFATLPAVENSYLACHLQGTGTLLNTKENF